MPAPPRKALLPWLAALLAVSCGGSEAPSPGASGDPSGAITVSGTERLAWSQAGPAWILRFRAYVDGQAVALDAATCDDSAPVGSCSSPLPPLTNGIHTVALTAIDRFSGAESERSAPITVKKVSGLSAMGAAAVAVSGGRPGAPGLEISVTASDGLAFSAGLVGTGVRAPAQLAWLPDQRLIVAEADGQVRIVDLGQESDGGTALDAAAIPAPGPSGPPGLTVHPDFARNRLVFLSLVSEDSEGRRLLRVLRLREVGGKLGEAAAIFEAPLVDVFAVTPPAGAVAASRMPAEWRGEQVGLARTRGPRLAFGPDGLLYIALPPGFEFDSGQGASAPHASLLRIREDGRAAVSLPPLTGVTTTPLGFDWHPSTGALWVLLAGRDGGTELRSLADGRASGIAEPGPTATHVSTQRGGIGALRFLRSGGKRSAWQQALVVTPDDGTLGIVTFAPDARAERLQGGELGPIFDLAISDTGTLFVVTDVGGGGAPGAVGMRNSMVVRLTPQAR